MPSPTNEEEIECDQLIARMGAVRLRRGSTGNLIARMTVESNFGPWPSCAQGRGLGIPRAPARRQPGSERRHLVELGLAGAATSRLQLGPDVPLSSASRRSPPRSDGRTPEGRRAGNQRSAAAANAVTKNGDGTVSVEINALHDAEGLERNLHQGDIPAVVRYLPPDQGRGRTRSRSSSQLGAATRSREAGRSRCAGTGVCASRSTKRSPAHCRTDRQRRTPRMAVDPGQVSCPDRYPACSGPRRRCAP